MVKSNTRWVIIVGATGFVGSYVSKELSRSFKTINTSRNRHEGFVQFDIFSDKISDLVSKISIDPQNLQIVLCNKFGPMENYKFDAKFARLCEVDSVRNLSKNCTDMDVPITYLSTSYVYPGDRPGYEETSPTRPISLYGNLKLEAEQILLKSNKKNLIFRLDKVVGNDVATNHLFSEWYHLARKGQNIRCIKGQNFSPTLVTDIAISVDLALKNKLSGIFNCVNPEIWSRSDLAKYFLRSFGLNANVTQETLEELGLSEIRPMHSNLNSEKLKNAIGIEFTPMSSVFSQMKKTIE
jgi:dTDP-4-dehydrorhamnose reductase